MATLTKEIIKTRINPKMWDAIYDYPFMTVDKVLEDLIRRATWMSKVDDATELENEFMTAVAGLI